MSNGINIDISSKFGLSQPTYVNIDSFQNLLDEQTRCPDLELHMGDKFIALRNSDGEHIVSVGFEF
jgi:hypothetical protein